jgi:hypothetical protein
MAWRHTIYLGVYALKTTYETLAEAFGEDPEAYERASDGQSACAGIVVDQDGRIIPDSPVVSSALWAVAQIRTHGAEDSTWTHGFEHALTAFTDAVDSLEGKRREAHGRDEPVAVDHQAVADLLHIAHMTAGIDDYPDLASRRVIIDSTAVSAKRAESGVDSDFLNSFYLDDLAHVSSRVATGEIGSGLAAYLTADRELRTAQREDIVAQPETVDAGTSIDRLPVGRWPARPDHPLALSQQFAVNHALRDLGAGEGLIGVNGPPGTGKTTMIRDILAGNVVERARKLAVLDKPSDAFTSVTHRWSDGEGHARIVPQLRPELIGFEMVVASSNNAAVENISITVTDALEIAETWRDSADYFADIATEIRRGVSTEEDPGHPSAQPRAWGLIAARLGKKQNRSAFRSAFWFDEKTATDAAIARGTPRMQTTLNRWIDGSVPFRPWHEARSVFNDALQRVEHMLHERAQAEQRLRRLPVVKRQAYELRLVIRDQEQSVAAAQRDLPAARATERHATTAYQRAVERHARHLTAQPSWWETVLSFGRSAREWRRQLDPISQRLDEAERERDVAVSRRVAIDEVLEVRNGHLSATRSDLEQLRDYETRLTAACARDAERFGKHYPSDARSEDERQIAAPWLDEELEAARSELFLAALTLHQDFIANTAKTMLNGLRAACEVITGHYPRDLEPEKIRAAWQVFFLVVPMISTTFASTGRMFAGLGASALGWLLIDEAGQASPQCAVGALWRAQRIVAVGDPLQLEPVVTLPEKSQRIIATRDRVSTTWIPPRASVQTLADRVTRFGTTLSQGEDDVWVSAPLRVHRRCDDPMFTLCNTIAYNGLMVRGVHRKLDDSDAFDPHGTARIAPSHWADEPATTPGSHLQTNQVARLESALRYIAGQDIPFSDVIAISPFRAMADRMRALSAQYPGLRAGTIHTAQGREASIVLLVLGGDPAKPGAAASWARTPNLVNVAASRAQRRLYVIGDRKAWSRHPYFRELSAALSSGH